MDVVVTPPSPPSRPSLGGFGPQAPLALDQIKAGDIAISLSVIEGEYYSKITQADYIAHLHGTPITKHIEWAIELNNRLANWVKKTILR
jgi:hypothetical protein